MKSSRDRAWHNMPDLRSIFGSGEITRKLAGTACIQDNFISLFVQYPPYSP